MVDGTASACQLNYEEYSLGRERWRVGRLDETWCGGEGMSVLGLAAGKSERAHETNERLFLFL